MRGVNTPPALPGADEYGGYLAKYAPARQKTYATVVDQVLDGTRFVTIPYVFSIVIMTFQRNIGDVHEVRTGEWPIGKVLKATVITYLFGWWGFPFGIIFSLWAAFYLFRGGYDVTQKVLEKTVSREEARKILRAAKKPKPPASIWVVRAILAFPFILLGSIILSGLSAQ